MNWHWYDTLMVAICWGALFGCFGLKWYLDRKWEKKFGEKKP